jgi:hypothetical protein
MANKTFPPDDSDNDMEVAEVVNRMTGEIVAATDDAFAAFRTPEAEGIRLLNQPRDYRALVEKSRGEFTCGDVMKGKSLKMRILRYRVEQGVRFSEAYPQPETVVQVLFIDEQDLVSTVVFRTSSYNNFMRLVDNLTAEKRAVASVIVSADMDKVTSKNNYTFHVVRFSYEPNTEADLKRIMDFVKANQEALYCFRELPKEAGGETMP